MKKSYINLIILSLVLLMGACQSDSPGMEPIVESPHLPIEEPSLPPFDFSSLKEGDEIPIYYTEDKGVSFIAEYKAVRIGEYLWMNSNFTYPLESGYDISQSQINFGLEACRINLDQYSLTPAEITEHIGQYYSQNSIQRMNSVGTMYESEVMLNRGKWGVPSRKDFQQLFAMCGDGQEHSVRFALCYKVGEIPLMKKTQNAFWITDNNTNRYGFGLIYAGQRAHNDGFVWGTCHNYPNDCVEYNSKKGDFVICYTTAVFPADGGNSTVILHDYPDTNRGKEWALKNMRWCRKLTDDELGYKLYVNKERTDIIKLGLDKSPPSGYEELMNGYLRGFYVQHILENPDPALTVPQLREMEMKVPDVLHGSVSPT
ncbi:MAG: FISUMP domain-containing protein [Dysgonomonas sp.]|nr:FISUMP domain-containing protein [Dysgonomonas sp.]